jgi:hypothetical protein
MLLLALQGGMNVTVKTGGARMVLRDVLRRPLVEVELGAVEGALKRLRPGVLQASGPRRPLHGHLCTVRRLTFCHMWFGIAAVPQLYTCSKKHESLLSKALLVPCYRPTQGCRPRSGRTMLTLGPGSLSWSPGTQ